MFENKNNTPLSEIGEFGLIEHLTKKFPLIHSTTQKGIGDDAAVMNFTKGQTVVTTDLLIEGIHFDLSYVPLKHLDIYLRLYVCCGLHYEIFLQVTHLGVFLVVRH